MASVQIQFHADPREALRLAQRWAEELEAEMVVEQNFPTYHVVAVGRGRVSDAAEALERTDRVGMCRGKPDLAAATPHDFSRR